MKKNKFTRIPIIPTRTTLENLIPNLTYKKLKVDELPHEIKSNGLTSKFNSVLVAASGSTGGTMVFTFNGIRIDHDKIDEHPFVIYFDGTDSTKDFGGIIDHGDWPDRTTSLEPWQETAISASGITADFSYKGILPGTSGSLYDLDDNGMLTGFKKQATILIKNKPDNG
jgi:hypothetical protein